jgi:hypothetical protein
LIDWLTKQISKRESRDNLTKLMNRKEKN